VSFRVAFVSQFRSILMKYIPGKIWIIVGRANIVSQHGYTLKYCSFVSGFMQLVTIISGLLVGIFGILYFEFLFLPSIVSYIVLVFLILCLLLFSREFSVPELNNKFVPKAIQPLAGRKIPPVSDIILLSILHWILMGCAFFLFFQSITLNIGLYPILLQPMANNIGIISPFAPGGLGVREGVMIGYLSLGGLSVSSATGISIAARLWFWVGELVIFIMGWAVQRKPKQFLSATNKQ